MPLSEAYLERIQLSGIVPSQVGSAVIFNERCWVYASRPEAIYIRRTTYTNEFQIGSVRLPSTRNIDDNRYQRQAHFAYFQRSTLNPNPTELREILINNIFRVYPDRFEGHENAILEEFETALFGPCETCGIVGCDRAPHLPCVGEDCDAWRMGSRQHDYCEDCAIRYRWNCSICNHTFIGPRQHEHRNRPYCSDCWSRVSACDLCNVLSTEMLEIPDYGTLCNACAEERNLVRSIGSWDWRPALTFHPSSPTNPKKPLYMGLEIETSLRPNVHTSDLPFRAWLARLPEDLLFVKSDGSVRNGYELVTHPMEPKWAIANFPWQLLDEALELGALETHSSCGTHIHMNKEAFTTAHLWKFMQVHMRLTEFCQKVAGRENSDYARWDLGAQRKALKDIVRKKDERISDYARYTALNLRNEYTIELRYMRGGSTPAEVKKNIQWAQALYEFSDVLTVPQLKAGALDDPGYLLAWINNGNYPYLADWLKNEFIVPKSLDSLGGN